jgi:surface antigen Omp85-like protein
MSITLVCAVVAAVTAGPPHDDSVSPDDAALLEYAAAEEESAPAATSAPPPSAAPTTAGEVAKAPPPDPALGERPDGRLGALPKRSWRIVPEILMFPFRAIFWGLRYPIEAALRFEDRYHTFQRITDAITWSGGTRGIRPAFYYSTIIIPEFGLTYFDHATLGPDTRLQSTTTVGGANYVYTDLIVEPTRMSAPIGVVLDVAFDRRGDLLYNGLGNHTYSDAPTGRYLQNALESHAALRVRPVHGLSLFASFGVGLKRFGNGDRVGGDEGIIYSFDTTTIPGFTEGTTFVRAATGVDIDSRATPLRGQSGIVAHALFDYSHGIDANDKRSYERLSAMLGFPIAVWAQHMFFFSATTSLAWPNDVDIPFSELPTLGGPNDLRGFRFLDFRDYSAFFVTAEYRWPVWMWVDAAVFFDYGGVFGKNYANFSARQMQPDVGLALRVVTTNRFLMRAQLGYGFGEGFNFSLSGMAQ